LNKYLVCLSLALLSGCAASPDHFYALSAKPAQAPAARSSFDTEMTLRVTLPTLIDRSEMVLEGSGSITILEHERWAAPLLDQATATLGQDIERRRPGILVTPHRPTSAARQVLRLNADIVHFSAHAGGSVNIETHWQISDLKTEQHWSGAEVFTSSAAGGGYDMIAAALSDCLAQLADRIVREVPATVAAP
jgi:uncharacterized protein